MRKNVEIFALEIRAYLAEITGKPYKYLWDNITPIHYGIKFRASKNDPTFDALLRSDENFPKEIEVCKKNYLIYLQKIRPETLTDKYK